MSLQMYRKLQSTLQNTYLDYEFQNLKIEVSVINIPDIIKQK